MDVTEANDDELYPEETLLDDVDAVIDLFAIGAKRQRDTLARWLVRIVEEDEDSAELADKALNLYHKLKHINQVRLIDLACGFWPAGPLVCGALLHEVLGDRAKIDRLFEHAGDDILRWFRRVPQDTLMSAEERRQLGALPSMIDAYHETTASKIGPRGHVALGPCWILKSPGSAAKAPTPAQDPAARLIKAKVPRSSVLVYYTGGGEPTLIVDFRRVASVEVLGG